jgi:isopentenyl-diphosphate delta-isomerase
MQIPIVNENDELIGYKKKETITPIDIYRVASLRVMNEKGEHLLTQRATTKSHSPNKRTLAVNGTVEQGESYEENIVKETQEEIGVHISKPRLLFKELFASNYKHFVAVFFVQLPKETPFTFDEREIQAVKRVSTQALEARLANTPDDFVTSFPNIRSLIREKLEKIKK